MSRFVERYECPLFCKLLGLLSDLEIRAYLSKCFIAVDVLKDVYNSFPIYVCVVLTGRLVSGLMGDVLTWAFVSAGCEMYPNT